MTVTFKPFNLYLLSLNVHNALPWLEFITQLLDIQISSVQWYTKQVEYANETYKLQGTTGQFKIECFCAHEFLNVQYVSVFIKLNIVAFITPYSVNTHTHTHKTHTHTHTHLCMCVRAYVNFLKVPEHFDWLYFQGKCSQFFSLGSQTFCFQLVHISIDLCWFFESICTVMKEIFPLETVKQVVDLCIKSVRALFQLKNVVYLQLLRDETRQMELTYFTQNLKKNLEGLNMQWQSCLWVQIGPTNGADRGVQEHTV
jgi:hypothetical protein